MNGPPLKRLGGLLGVLLVGFAGIVVRLGVLQVRDASALETLAMKQRIRTVDLPARRGALLDRNGERLALSLPARDVYADPRYVRDPQRTAARVAPILHIPKRRVLSALRAGGTFVWLARQVDAGVAAKVERLAVRHEFRNRHIGGKLMETGVELCRMKGYRRIYGRAQKHLMSYYANMGWNTWLSVARRAVLWPKCSTRMLVIVRHRLLR